MSDPIRAIVRTFTSARDLNGNCYHFCYVFDVRQGIYKRLMIETGGAGNGAGLVQRILGGYASVFSAEETIPKRQWQAMRSNAECLYEHEAEAPLRKFLKVRKPKLGVQP